MLLQLSLYKKKNHKSKTILNKMTVMLSIIETITPSEI